MGKMDNILKLLIGVLGVAGLLAMLAPSNFVPTEPEPVTEAPPPAQPVDLLPVPEEPATSEGQVYNFKMGEPTIDGKPIMDPESPLPMNNNIEVPSQPVVTTNGEVAQPAQSGFIPPSNDSAEVAAPAM